ncbi:hypothetical protein [Pikeienuella sp. HZG-20]|uniref:hypothetical protein n=1 Tax=Paludibacillus litoralis TaxID=3133267 RepID=UPI0030EBCAC4
MPVPAIYRKPAGAPGAIPSQASIENIVFEGGGPKGLVHIGGVRVLEEKRMTAGLRNVGGASARAMMTSTVGLGFDAAQTRESGEAQFIGGLTATSDDDMLSCPAKAIQDQKNLFGASELRGRSPHRGEKLHAWFASLIDRRVAEAKALLEPQGAEATAFRTGLAAKRGDIRVSELARRGEMSPDPSLRDLAFIGANHTDRRIALFSAAGLRKIRRGMSRQGPATPGVKVGKTDEIRTILREAAQEDRRSELARAWDDIKARLEASITRIAAAAANTVGDKVVHGEYAQRTVQIPDLYYSNLHIRSDRRGKSQDARRREKRDTGTTFPVFRRRRGRG